MLFTSSGPAAADTAEIRGREGERLDVPRGDAVGQQCLETGDRAVGGRSKHGKRTAEGMQQVLISGVTRQVGALPVDTYDMAHRWQILDPDTGSQ